MSKILHVANGNEKHLGKRYYSFERKLQNGLIRASYDSLFFSDRDVKRSSGLLGTNWRGEQNCNKKLLQVVKNFAPDILLLGHANIIDNQSLAAIKVLRPNIKIAQYNVDALFRVENVAAIESRLAYVDASFFTTAGDAIKDYGRAYYIPNPVDASIDFGKCFEHETLLYDVFFACRAATTKGAHDATDRIIIPQYLQQSAPHLRYNFHGFSGVCELFGAKFYDELTLCAIGLNISQKQTTRGELRYAEPAQKHLYSSDRIAQYLGCGLLVCTERGFALEEFFAPDEQMIFFSSKEELKDKLIYYTQNIQARAKIARAGWEFAHNELNSTLVAKFMIEAIMEQQFSHNYYWQKFN